MKRPNPLCLALGCLMLVALSVALATPAHAEEDDDQPPVPRFTPIPRPTPLGGTLDGYRIEPEKNNRFTIEATALFVEDYDFTAGVEAGLGFTSGRASVDLEAFYTGASTDISFGESADISIFGADLKIEVSLGKIGNMPFWLEPYLDIGARPQFVEITTSTDRTISADDRLSFFEFQFGGGTRFYPLRRSRFAIDAGFGGSYFTGATRVEGATRGRYSLGVIFPIARFVEGHVTFRGSFLSAEDKEQIGLPGFIAFPFNTEEEMQQPFIYESEGLDFGVVFRF